MEELILELDALVDRREMLKDILKTSRDVGAFGSIKEQYDYLDGIVPATKYLRQELFNVENDIRNLMVHMGELCSESQ